MCICAGACCWAWSAALGDGGGEAGLPTAEVERCRETEGCVGSDVSARLRRTRCISVKPSTPAAASDDSDVPVNDAEGELQSTSTLSVDSPGRPPRYTVSTLEVLVAALATASDGAGGAGDDRLLSLRPMGVRRAEAVESGPVDGSTEGWRHSACRSHDLLRAAAVTGREARRDFGSGDSLEGARAAGLVVGVCLTGLFDGCRGACIGVSLEGLADGNRGAAVVDSLVGTTRADGRRVAEVADGLGVLVHREGRDAELGVTLGCSHDDSVLATEDVTMTAGSCPTTSRGDALTAGPPKSGEPGVKTRPGGGESADAQPLGFDESMDLSDGDDAM